MPITARSFDLTPSLARAHSALLSEPRLALFRRPVSATAFAILSPFHQRHQNQSQTSSLFHLPAHQYNTPSPFPLSFPSSLAKQWRPWHSLTMTSTSATPLLHQLTLLLLPKSQQHLQRPSSSLEIKLLPPTDRTKLSCKNFRSRDLSRCRWLIASSSKVSTTVHCRSCGRYRQVFSYLFHFLLHHLRLPTRSSFATGSKGGTAAELSLILCRTQHGNSTG